ncbi:MAG: CoA transferase, partial [Methylobacteriaceae bacterium]|nr:CoA transferase [Methylobacteriaceae bacterium]
MIEGVKVLAFTHYLQGPSAAQTLADLGADVIKIESPNGAYERHWSGCNAYKNGVSVFFMLANRNQRDIALDLKSPEGKQIIYDLVKVYDVVIENFKVGVMDKLGLGYEELRKINPGIIYCSCTGYGSAGPMAREPGQDLLAQSLSGLVALSGPGDRPPVPVGVPVVDQHGAILAATGLLAAVIHRARTGEGCRIDNNLLNAAIDLQQEPITYFLNGSKLEDRPSTGLSSRFHQSPYGVYPTGDSYITVSLTPLDKLKALFTPGCLDAFTPTTQMENRVEFDRIVAEEMRKRSTAEWMALFKEHQVWHAPVNEYEDVVKHEQVIFNQVVL